MRKKIGTWDVILSPKKVVLSTQDPRVILTFDYPTNQHAKELYKKITSMRILKNVVKRYITTVVLDEKDMWFKY